MKAVYFDRTLTDQAPGLIGAFCTDPGAKWITLVDIMAALDGGDPVDIRPASETERERAEGIIVIGRIGAQITEAHRLGDAAHLFSADAKSFCENITALRAIGALLAAPLVGLVDSSIPVFPTNVGVAIL